MSPALPPALHHRQFRWFLLGLTLAWTGLQIQIWTSLWHIRNLTDDPSALGAAALFRFLPILICSLLAGVAADMFSRRTIMLLTQGVMGLVSLLLALALWREGLTVWLIYILLGLQATAFAFDLPARQSMVPNLVPAELLQNALSLQVISFQVGALLGPTLSGVAIDRWGEQSAFLISAILFGLFWLVLLANGAIPQRRLRRTRPRAALGDIREGIRYTVRHPLILPSMLLDFLATFFTRADALMPYFARDILGLGPVGYGWLSAGQAIGATTAGLSFSQVKLVRNQGRLLLLSVASIGAGAILFGISRSFALSLLALILIGGSDAISAIIRNTIRQMNTPDQLRGRMVSVNQIFFVGGPQLGDWKTALLGSWIGVPLAVVLGGLGCLLSTGWVARRWSQLASYSGIEPLPSAAD